MIFDPPCYGIIAIRRFIMHWQNRCSCCSFCCLLAPRRVILAAPITTLYFDFLLPTTMHQGSISADCSIQRQFNISASCRIRAFQRSHSLTLTSITACFSFLVPVPAFSSLVPFPFFPVQQQNSLVCYSLSAVSNDWIQLKSPNCD